MLEDTNLVEMTVDIVSNYVAHNNLRAEDVPAFIASTHAAVVAPAEPAQEEAAAPVPQYQPAVSVRKSLASHDHIISMIDGKPYRALKRHLSANGLTPAEYRERYGLRPDYPMVAPGYSETRREVAHRLGLGRNPRGAAADARPETTKAAAPKAARKPRVKKSDAVTV